MESIESKLGYTKLHLTTRTVNSCRIIIEAPCSGVLIGMSFAATRTPYLGRLIRISDRLLLGEW